MADADDVDAPHAVTISALFGRARVPAATAVRLAELAFGMPPPPGPPPPLPVPVTSDTAPTAAELLRAVRRRRELSQRELAALGGVPSSTVSRIEAGRTDPRMSTWLSLIRATGHDVTLRDHHGVLVVRDNGSERLRDRSGRRFPAHLQLFRTPRLSQWNYSWWGWYRIAWDDKDPIVPEWTYYRRRPPRRAQLADCRDRGLLWDDAT